MHNAHIAYNSDFFLRPSFEFQFEFNECQIMNINYTISFATQQISKTRTISICYYVRVLFALEIARCLFDVCSSRRHKIVTHTFFFFRRTARAARERAGHNIFYLTFDDIK